MSDFSPELYKAASGAKSLPINKDRTDDPSFQSPVFADYLAKGDLSGYMTALWQGAAARDIPSLRILIFLAIQAHEPENAMDLIDMLLDTDDEYVVVLGKLIHQAVTNIGERLEEFGDDEDKYYLSLSMEFHAALCKTELEYAKIDKEYNDTQSPFALFGEAENDLVRAYINNVGRQNDLSTFNFQLSTFPINPCVSEEKKNYWRGLYRRDDCSSNQAAIYQEALNYAKQGDPFAMYVAGYLLSHGIRTKYSNPTVTILEPNKQIALPFLRRAADAGVTEACWETAAILFDQGDEESKALGWQYVEKGAEKDDKDCLRGMIRRYEGEDDIKAFEYLARLAAQKSTHEQKLKLARWYETGRGCEKDEKKAFELVEYVYNNSSASPYDSSQEDSVGMLCRYLREGIGCEPDPERADKIYRWYQDDEDRMWELLSR